MHPRFSMTNLRNQTVNAGLAPAGHVLTNSRRFPDGLSLRAASDPLPIVRYAYYMFLFSIPFEGSDIGIESENFTITKMVGYLFIAVTLLQPHVCYRRPPKAFWYFMTYLSIFIILNALSEAETARMMPSRLLRITQLVIMFWLCYNLMRSEQFIKGTLLTLGASCTCLVILQMSGIITTTIKNERYSALDSANTYASILALGLLALLGLAYARKESDYKTRLFAWSSLGILAVAIVATGSRGALAALSAGLLLFFLHGRGLRSKLKVGMIVLLTMGLLGWASYQFDAVRARWEKTLYEGHLSKREWIFSKSWNMFLEKPLTGWGPDYFYRELGYRFGNTGQDAKGNPPNLFLWLLLETGLIGTIPFCIALWLCLRAAWKARSGIQGVLPLAMLICVLMVNMSYTWHNRKLFWFVLAYASASASYAVIPGRYRAVPRSQQLFGY
jgi:O-antigen ligase